MAEEFQRETIRSHFSHQHPLKLIVYKQAINITFPCAGCKLKPSGMLYTCSSCDYFLHQRCFEMPKKLTHPLHQQHPLALMLKSAYGDVRFVCDACGERGKGFSYHCKPCGFDFHMLCTMLPFSITHASHAMHKLNLASESPYPENKFSCDICQSIGSRQWLYRCKSCGFDAHLKCVAAGEASSVRPPSPSKEPIEMKTEEAAVSSKLAPSAPELPPMQLPSVMPDPPFEVNGSQNNAVALEAVKQMIISNSTALAQAILSGRVSGGDRGLHLLIEWISALNYSCVINGGGCLSALGYASGSGEGSQGTLQALNNGRGGDAACFVQAVTDSGGGGQEYLKPVMGSGGGGCGGGDSLPEKITHRFDKKHALTLQTNPAYAEGRFKCDACGEIGKGFSYICKPCGIDLHVPCAMMPFFVTHNSHVHTLRLTFVSPYPDKKFSCGVCLGPGSRNWLYRCDSCGFDAHMKCAGGDILPPHPPQSQPRDAAAWGRPPPPMMNSGFPEGQVNVPPFSVERRNNELAIQKMNINNMRMAQGLMRFISNGVSGGGEQQDYQLPILGDGNGIGFLGDLFGG